MHGVYQTCNSLCNVLQERLSEVQHHETKMLALESDLRDKNQTIGQMAIDMQEVHYLRGDTIGAWTGGCATEFSVEASLKCLYGFFRSTRGLSEIVQAASAERAETQQFSRPLTSLLLSWCDRNSRQFIYIYI